MTGSDFPSKNHIDKLHRCCDDINELSLHIQTKYPELSEKNGHEIK